jgi:hypothetical protein
MTKREVWLPTVWLLKVGRNFQVQVVVTAFDKGRSSLSVVETRRTSEPEKHQWGLLGLWPPTKELN